MADSTTVCPTPWRRRAARRLLGGPGRVPGVDVARGVAVLGMFVAHVGVTSQDRTQLSGWLGLAHGRSSILFALVAGISLALATGRDDPFDGQRARVRVLVRAVCLLVIGGLLDALGTRVYVILGFYAAYFVLAIPALRWSPRRLVGAAAVVAVVGPPLAYWGPEAMARAGLRMPRDGDGAVTHFLLSGNYPAVVWMAYVLPGIAIGRSSALTSPSGRAGLMVGGAGAWWLGSVASSLLVRTAGCEAAHCEAQIRGAVEQATHGSAAGFSTAGTPWPPVAGLFLAGPHDDTLFEVVASGGFAVMVVGLCLCVGRLGARVLAPLAAVGAMALTVYTAQIIAIWRFDLLGSTTNGPLLVLVAASLAGATVWRALRGRGPLERWVGALADTAGGRRAGHPRE